VFVAFGLISCEDTLLPSEYSPLSNDQPADGVENEPVIGYWRIEGAIDAPLDWNPQMHPDLFQIWFGATEPLWPLSEAECEPCIIFTLVFTGQDARRWHFKAEGPEVYDGDPYHGYFCPPFLWWSFPDETPPTFRRTWVQGYKLVEGGGGWEWVLADEEWSFSPKNHADGWPRPDWKYYQPYAPHGSLNYWAWTSVYLDLT